ncbi:Nitrite reductase [Planctomycetales bacterium 10988]|nr:Nitrite reductase [Planctomycetales bacterium 10988]
MSRRLILITILAVQLVLGLVLVHGLTVDRSPVSRLFLPGETTHGHYQIELSCRACHTPTMGVKQEACTDCHGAELKQADDTHPVSKFTNPANAHLIEKLDARYCTTCHQEHVPHRTFPMGLSLPEDYCYRCHSDVAEQRPSHEGFTFKSCSTSGCHNFHDNTSLYENFLNKNADQPAVLSDPHYAVLNFYQSEKQLVGKPLKSEDSDAPSDAEFTKKVHQEWAESSHAAAGVNCSHCHVGVEGTAWEGEWSDQVDYLNCEECHAFETSGFLGGKHGMRLAAGLSPMTPGMARLPMKESARHAELSCKSCHSDHTFDTQFAAVNACLKCHDDQHSLDYRNSSHYELWQSEVNGEAPPGSGVSCATCHLPRIEHGGDTRVEHNQNATLRPNEKMIRSTCMQCHGLQFSLDALADEALIQNNFQGEPTVDIESARMAVEWFDRRNAKREQRRKQSD